MTGEAFFHPLRQILFVRSAAAAAIGLSLVALPRRRGPPPAKLTALVTVACVVVVLQVTGNPVRRALIGLIALTVTGILDRARRFTRAQLVVALVPGALLLAYDGGVPKRWWVALVVASVVVVGSPLIRDLDRLRPRWAPVLVAISAGGIYATVPDTEQALALLGAAAIVAVVSWVFRWRLGSIGIPALIGLVAWIIAVGGRGRAGSVVGGVTCLALLMAEPVGRAVARAGPTARPIYAPIVLMLHATAVIVASRVGGLRVGAGSAAVICVLVLVGAVVAYTALNSVGSKRLPGGNG